MGLRYILKWTCLPSVRLMFTSKNGNFPPFSDSSVKRIEGCWLLRCWSSFGTCVFFVMEKTQQRIKEHKADTRIGRVDKSAIAEHAHVTGHRIYWEPMVIERETARRKKESERGFWHIHRMKRRGGSMNQGQWLAN